MGTEIERKFLLSGDGWRAAADEGTDIRQFYLAIREGLTVRARIKGEAKALLTIKSGVGMTRGEYEYEIPLADARELEAVRVGSLIAKRRFRVPLGALVVEVDCFSGDLAPLVLAEIELPAEDHAVDLPDWLGEEVTEDGRYTNAALAMAGRPPPR
ncbi:adenylate cyclase [Aureimonas ureilytica]|uniref:Adenylate cyclase n=1 Tax=Aureimonas ureilytica TaxID=401562 RepID=A0A175RTK1_9HYPH|nr:CYTH domain-containing protein [Aureimonas ureilytica]KTR06801.1 adenylate cyclase [Aureimonas ureilytica]